MNDISTSNTQTTPIQGTPKNLVPLGVTIGLTIFALLLTLMGYGFRLLVGDSVADVVRHAAVVLSFFLIVFPALITAGSKLMNKFTGTRIQTRNAWTLGLLLSCVMILTMMGQYS